MRKYKDSNIVIEHQDATLKTEMNDNTETDTINNDNDYVDEPTDEYTIDNNTNNTSVIDDVNNNFDKDNNYVDEPADKYTIDNNTNNNDNTVPSEIIAITNNIVANVLENNNHSILHTELRDISYDIPATTTNTEDDSNTSIIVYESPLGNIYPILKLYRDIPFYPNTLTENQNLILLEYDQCVDDIEDFMDYIEEQIEYEDLDTDDVHRMDALEKEVIDVAIQRLEKELILNDELQNDVPTVSHDDDNNNNDDDDDDDDRTIQFYIDYLQTALNNNSKQWILSKVETYEKYLKIIKKFQHDADYYMNNMKAFCRLTKADHVRIQKQGDEIDEIYRILDGDIKRSQKRKSRRNKQRKLIKT